MSAAEAVQNPAEAVAPAEEEKAIEQPEATETKDVKETEEKKNGANILKTTAKIDRENLQNNRKFDASVRKVTDDPEEIRKQVEFYFGDWNFPQDKFMWETCGGSENKPMPIEKIHSFKRMRCFQPYSAVVAALKESKILEVSGEEGKEVVKRKVPYKPVPASKAKAEAATVYVKGFGDEQPDTQFELETFFSQFGEVNGLKLRRTNESLFKGSVFVTFADEETAKKFIATDPAPKWKDHDLKIMSKHDYCEEKSELIKQGKLVPSGTSQKKFFEGKDFGKKNTRNGSGDQDDWKKRRDQDQKSGFRDRRGGGRGRGRGGRGRGGRDGRRDRDSGREEKRVDAAATNLKRPREDDSGAAPAAKKVDTKDE
ncbi:rna-binding la domain [Trichoderma arundinaceum]|uniref:Rna-binding la domain n=1 Tax=Trichoderma arundinaceum TaxID=490622 RepID=A0A395N7V0_TRIAR|nr:rna-binding la domain [Trichoderma arundinaceum]